MKFVFVPSIELIIPVGDSRIRKNLHRWCMDFAIVHMMSPETVREYMDPELLEGDDALEKLKNPQEYTDEEVFSALCRAGGDKRLVRSPVLLKEKDRGTGIFAQAWRNAARQHVSEGHRLFTLCFGRKHIHRWYPFANAVYYWREKPEDITCVLNSCRSYGYRQGQWIAAFYEKLGFDIIPNGIKKMIELP